MGVVSGIVAVVFLALLGVVIYFAVSYYKSKKSGGYDPSKSAVILSKSTTGPVQQMTVPEVYAGGQDKAQATLTLSFNITAYTQTDQHMILLSMNSDKKDVSTQRFMILLDKDYNNAYFMFNQSGTAGTTASTVASDSFCAFELQNIPLYRWAVMHVVYDQANGNAKIFIDGELVKVCNLFICNQVIQSDFNVTKVSAGYIKTDNTDITKTPWPDVMYHDIILVGNAKDTNDIIVEYESIIAKLATEEAARIKAALVANCPTRPM